MALRRERGAGRRRADRGRARTALLAVALYLAAGVLATAPALGDARTHFLGFGRPAAGVTPGDHLQTAYHLWLPGHQVERGAAPWVDPYSFQPVVEPRVNFAGWPFALVWWPLDLVLDTVGAWNAFVLLTYVGAGGFAALWLRSLGLSTGGALVGGLAFALAPYRVAQSTGHLLGPISILLPLALWGVETRRRWLAALAIASIPLSGQVHLALGSIPFFAAYAVARRGWRPAVPGVVASVAAGVLVWAASIRGTAGTSGRTFDDVERYSAELADFVSRDMREFEAFVLLGWLVPLAALAGLLVVARERPRLAAALGAGALLPLLLALGANLPGYRTLWELTPLRDTRVPERLMPIACLCLAGLLAFAVDRVRWRVAPLAAVALVALDLRGGVELYRPLTADEGNDSYAVLRAAPAGRVLDDPVRPPDAYANSVYLYYTILAPRERVLGYSTTAPPEAAAAARGLRAALCGRRPDRLRALLGSLGVGFVVVHPGGGGDRPCYRARTNLVRAGYRNVFGAGRLAVLVTDDHLPPPS